LRFIEKAWEGKATGTTFSAISGDILRSQEIPVAPLAEQQHIVEAIDTQFTRLDAGVDALKRLRTKLKRYKAAVLKAACEGSLVEQNPNDEPAYELLARILQERRQKWEDEQRAKGKDPRKLKYEAPIAPDTSNLPELPEGWIWASLGQIFNVYVGATPSRAKPEYWDGHIPWVSSGEVAFCRIKSTRESITELGLENTSTELHPTGTILLGMIGEGKTRGQVAILDMPATHNQNSAAIRVSEAGLPPEYTYYFLESTYEQTRRGSSGNNQPALNKARVQAMIFPLPPYDEQKRIVTELDRLLSFFDELMSSIENSLKRANRLRQSILKEAFSGRLVPQDLNEEPASELLKRIKQERLKQTKGTKRLL
jgi:type I restriction enzyme, S subunit